MIDLRSLPDDAFIHIVTPMDSNPYSRITIQENGFVLLSSKVAEQFAKKPVQMRFNKDCSAIQLFCIGEDSSMVFPKSGRKMLPSAKGFLQDSKIDFPAEYRGYCIEEGKWRGELQPNPTVSPSPSTRSMKKK